MYQLLRKEELLSQQERELQQKEAEIQSAKRGLSEARGKFQAMQQQQHEESCRLNSELEIEREELLLLREEADKKISELEGRCQELQAVIQQSQNMVSSLEKSLHDLQAENESLKLQQQKVRRKVAEVINHSEPDIHGVQFH
ncbi:hypothetical protein XENOCAPTIV_025767 [Xenoophorus captivus]|uniref:Uncharacterized protein n=1 Tax=Xenoophorus captivus TaxID=1517983 RepID=A0ABV0RIY3_9TELE